MAAQERNAWPWDSLFNETREVPFLLLKFKQQLAVLYTNVKIKLSNKNYYQRVIRYLPVHLVEECRSVDLSDQDVEWLRR